MIPIKSGYEALLNGSHHKKTFITLERKEKKRSTIQHEFAISTDLCEQKVIQQRMVTPKHIT
jgi:hypothetical protein